MGAAMSSGSRRVMTSAGIPWSPVVSGGHPTAYRLSRVWCEAWVPMGNFRGLPQEVMSTDLERFGKLRRGGKTLHRFRLGDYRVYFERHQLGVLVHRIMSRHTLKDFFFRSGIKMGEDEALQENPKFWELIEAAKSSETK